jgi:hypothetical protein
MLEDSSWIDAVRSCLEVIGGVQPLRLRFSMLNHKYLISAFLDGGHPLRRLLLVLSGLNSTNMVREFDMVGDHDLEPIRSVYDYPLEALLNVPNINDVMEQELTFVGWDSTKWWWHRRRRDLTLNRYFSLIV